MKWWIAYSFSPLGAPPDMIGPWSYPFDLSPRCTLSHSAMSYGASTSAVQVARASLIPPSAVRRCPSKLDHSWSMGRIA